jgi:hypothetical protein
MHAADSRTTMTTFVLDHESILATQANTKQTTNDAWQT